MKEPLRKPPTSPCVMRGRQTVAQYRDQEIERYRGNPFIEALPPILTEDQAMDLLARYPKYDEKERLLPAHLRLHMVLNVAECFVCLPVHLDLEQRFSRLLLGAQSRGQRLSPQPQCTLCNTSPFLCTGIELCSFSSTWFYDHRFSRCWKIDVSRNGPITLSASYLSQSLCQS